MSSQGHSLDDSNTTSTNSNSSVSSGNNNNDNNNDALAPLSVSLLALTPQEAWNKLNEVDPIMAAKWHVNNTRRVLRSLQVWEQTGKPQSQHYVETGGIRGHDGTQYKCVILWLDANKQVTPLPL
jgi:tRNA A37 N6-isopentenylltransferase MiaA